MRTCSAFSLYSTYMHHPPMTQMINWILGEHGMESILQQATTNPSRSLHVQRPENLGSDDEAGLHIRRRVGLPECFVGYLKVLRARVRIR